MKCGSIKKKVESILFGGFFGVSSIMSAFSGSYDSSNTYMDLVREIRGVLNSIGVEDAEPPSTHKGVGEHYNIKTTIPYSVLKGDNIYKISNRMKAQGIWIKPMQIAKHNSLSAPNYYLTPGQFLEIPVLEWGTQVVEASWYGPGFHGKPMANTNIFNENELVAAHMHLPLGIKVRVTNLENGKSIVVPITDRGNFEKYNRGIDLSKQAAKELGYFYAGTTRVLIEPLQETFDASYELAIK